MSYWRGAAARPARIVQFTSSGFKNVMPTMIIAVDRSAGVRPADDPGQPRHRAHRLGPPAGRPRAAPARAHAGRPRPERCAPGSCRRRCMIPTWGWPDDNDPDPTAPFDPDKATRLNPATPPDWRWRVTPLLDRAGRRRPARADPAAGHRRRSDRRRPRRSGDRRRTPTRRSPPATSTPSATSATPARSCSAATSALCRFNELADGRLEARPRGVHRVRRPGQPGRRGAQGRASTCSRRPRSDRTTRHPPSRLRRLAIEVPRARCPMAEQHRSSRRSPARSWTFFEFVKDAARRGRRATGADQGPRRQRRPRPGDAGLPDGAAGGDQGVPRRRRPRRRRRAGGRWPTSSLLLDAIASNVEAWALDDLGEGFDQLGQSLLDLVASNYFRLRFPRLFLMLQAVAAIEEATTTYGAGTNNLVRIGSALQDRSGSSWSARASSSTTSTRARRRRCRTIPTASASTRSSIDGALPPRRRGARLDARQRQDRHHRRPARRLGRPRPRHRLGGARRHGPTSSPTRWCRSRSPPTSQRRRHRRRGGRAAPAQPRLRARPTAAGRACSSPSAATSSASVELSERWTFSVKLRSDAGVAALIGGDVGFDGDLADGNFAASVGWASRPDPTTRLTYVVPRPTGSRLEIGQLACSLALRQRRGRGAGERSPTRRW